MNQQRQAKIAERLARADRAILEDTEKCAAMKVA